MQGFFVTERLGSRLLEAHASAYQTNSPFYPVIDLLERALAHAEGADYPYLKTFTLPYAVQLYLARRKPRQAKEHLEALLTLAPEQRFTGWLAYGRV